MSVFPPLNVYVNECVYAYVCVLSCCIRTCVYVCHRMHVCVYRHDGWPETCAGHFLCCHYLLLHCLLHHCYHGVRGCDDPHHANGSAGVCMCACVSVCGGIVCVWMHTVCVCVLGGIECVWRHCVCV